MMYIISCDADERDTLEIDNRSGVRTKTKTCPVITLTIHSENPAVRQIALDRTKAAELVEILNTLITELKS